MIILTDEQGNDLEYEPLDLIELDGKEYAVLISPDPEDQDSVIIMQVSEEEGDQITELSTIEDEALLNTLFDLFKQRHEGEQLS